MFQKLKHLAKVTRERREQEADDLGYAPPAVDEAYAYYTSKEPGMICGPIVTWGLACQFLLNNQYFQLVMNLIIVLAGVLVGISFYDFAQNNDTLVGLENFVLVRSLPHARVVGEDRVSCAPMLRCCVMRHRALSRFDRPACAAS
jgi:hypothetical protein